MDNLWLVVLAMGAVTYIPRMLPLVMLNNIELPPHINSFLQFIPFAALSASFSPEPSIPPATWNRRLRAAWLPPRWHFCG
ncbi:MAG: AzlD domain-containing protein [Peptococcaceae bacterium]|nr:AzlD domain-containing protein [Peptococcaceae bacterium]